MTRKFLFSLLAVWVFVFAYETLLHGFLLESAYRDLAGIFRAPEDSVALLPILLAGHLLIAVGITYVIAVLAKPESFGRAAMIGALLGLAFGGGTAALQFVALPVSATLAAGQAVGAVVELALAATIARLVSGRL